MTNHVAARMNLLSGESAFAVMTQANQLEAEGRSIVHLEIGQPDFQTPAHIIDAAVDAMNRGQTGYTLTRGILPLREAIAHHCLGHKNVKTDPGEIVVVPGGKPVIFYTMLMLVEPGDEVICPDPGFPIYESATRFAGGKVVPLPLLEQRGFSPDLQQLAAAINGRTRLIILNSPGNPTGGVISGADIRALAELLKDYPDIYVLSDEIYDCIVFDEAPVSIASFPWMKDRTIILDGFSKAYAMTGWRIGYGVMNRELAQHMEMLMVNSNSCATSISQWAALAAYTGPQDAVIEMVAQFRARRDRVVTMLNQIDGIRCVEPQGAFYAFPNISAFGLTSGEFASRLLTEGGVAAAGGSSFGAHGEGYLRLSCANSLENLEIAIERLADFTKTL